MRKIYLSLVVCFTLLCSSLSFAAKHVTPLTEHHIYRVIRVIDGDTIKLDNKQNVRLIGIDTPESKDNAKLRRDVQQRHISKRLELIRGKKAYQFTKRLVEGKKVYLEFDKRTYDDYDRVLAYVYLVNGTFVNAEIVKAGYAYVYSIKPDLKHSQLFQKLYEEAKQTHKGLWQQNKKGSSKAVKWFKDN